MDGNPRLARTGGGPIDATREQRRLRKRRAIERNKPPGDRFSRQIDNLGSGGLEMASIAAAEEEAETGPSAPPEVTARPIARRALLGAATALAVTAAFGETAAAAPSGDRTLALYNPYTDEHFQDVYWCDGSYVASSLHRVDWLMRDFHQDKVAVMDPALLDLLHRIALRLETRRPFHVLSGYRTPATNRMLRIEGYGAALHSEHLHAKAADICIDGVRLIHLRRAALSLKAGGVGTYWHYRFVHVDVGPVRHW